MSIYITSYNSMFVLSLRSILHLTFYGNGNISNKYVCFFIGPMFGAFFKVWQNIFSSQKINELQISGRNPTKQTDFSSMELGLHFLLITAHCTKVLTT